ncbi:Histidine kinase [Filimonas lacunae]|uniref:Histidine kinase n=1 Tax=Filimonas lacunae TaxID=477680 RepID=A0A1N7QDU8_9BACT|nr:histidine kinase [Filimonas lacunae]SIT20747.1 Histidine kinase [Filimonas lacunae]
MNVLLTIIVSITVFLFLLLSQPFYLSVFYLFTALIIISLVGFVNLYLLVFFQRRFEQSKTQANTIRYIASYAASTLVYLAMWPLFAWRAHLSWTSIPLHQLLTFLISNVMINTFVLLMQDYVIVTSQKIRSDLEIAHLKTAQAEAANLLLKQQIHPHFLFNALNTLKTLYKKDQKNGETYLLHLANFLRASVSTHTERLSSVDEEIAILKDYVEMQLIRFKGAFECTINIPAHTYHSCALPTFSLQPLVENAIKHNEVTNEQPLAVSIVQKEDYIIVSNNLQRKSVREISTGNGLANLSERYKLLSGEDILIREDAEVFSVSIKLLPYEHSNYRR